VRGAKVSGKCTYVSSRRGRDGYSEFPVLAIVGKNRRLLYPPAYAKILCAQYTPSPISLPAKRTTAPFLFRDTILCTELSIKDNRGIRTYLYAVQKLERKSFVSIEGRTIFFFRRRCRSCHACYYCDTGEQKYDEHRLRSMV